jgi:hypothetical protein
LECEKALPERRGKERIPDYLLTGLYSTFALILFELDG